MTHLTDEEQLRTLIQSEWSNPNSILNVVQQGISPPPTLKELLPSLPGPSGILPPEAEETQVVRRFKPPFDSTNKHDARGDAISIAHDFLVQKRIPIWACHLIAHQFVDDPEIQQKFQLDNFKTNADEEYERINAFSWCRDLIQQFNQYMIEMANGKQNIPKKPPKCDEWPISFSATRNKKPKMEDRNTIIPSFSCIEPQANYDKKDDAFFAVFDGHNGHEVAAYLASHFYRSFLEPANNDPNPMERLRKAYAYTDKILNLRCEKENYRGGSTAAGVLISQNSLYMFWCGDASIGILNNKLVKTLSGQHVPSNEKEYERVLSNGGSIVNVNGELRVNGVLNITRSMGELFGKPMISSEPDMDNYKLSDNDWLLFLASDGVWDELSTTEIRDHCFEFANRYPSDHYIHLADYIVADARRAGSKDNMTLIIVFLKPINEVWAHLAN